MQKLEKTNLSIEVIQNLTRQFNRGQEAQENSDSLERLCTL